MSEREFYPGWADAAGRAAASKPQPALKDLPYMAPQRRTQWNEAMGESRGAHRRALAAGRFESGVLPLDTALRETSRYR